MATQVTGNIGMYYAAYRLSRLGWNVMPTARNARGVDLLIYSDDAKTTRTIQVKALSRRSPVPLGKSVDHLMADYWVILINIATDNPTSFIMTPGEVRDASHRGEKDGRVSHWLQPNQYDKPEFREKWDRIGHGWLESS